MKTRTCSKCSESKSLESFHFRKDLGDYRNQCKECWKYITASHRYGVPFEQVKNFYASPHCMCCGKLFNHKRDQQLHHVNHKVKGILCKYCNLALRQETEADLSRLEGCLKFISEPRKNLLDRVNQQGSRKKDSDPSTTARAAQSKVCKTCGASFPLSSFYLRKNSQEEYKPITQCKECYKVYVKTFKYGLSFEQVAYLRDFKTCQACSCELKIPYIHHIGDDVLGVLCRECNILIEQESPLTVEKLEACKQWLVMVQSEL